MFSFFVFLPLLTDHLSQTILYAALLCCSKKQGTEDLELAQMLQHVNSDEPECKRDTGAIWKVPQPALPQAASKCAHSA